MQRIPRRRGGRAKVRTRDLLDVLYRIITDEKLLYKLFTTFWNLALVLIHVSGPGRPTRRAR